MKAPAKEDKILSEEPTIAPTAWVKYTLYGDRG